jgi:hypothetical protein
MQFLMVHRRAHDLQPFTIEHFDRWCGMWVAMIEDRRSGPLTEKTKAHGARFATIPARQNPKGLSSLAVSVKRLGTIHFVLFDHLGRVVNYFSEFTNTVLEESVNFGPGWMSLPHGSKR